MMRQLQRRLMNVLVQKYYFQEEMGTSAKQYLTEKPNVGGELIGIRDTKPILDTRVYDDVFPGGVEGVEVSANQLSGSILTLCDA